jgi:hypothetical protein
MGLLVVVVIIVLVVAGLKGFSQDYREGGVEKLDESTLSCFQGVGMMLLILFILFILIPATFLDPHDEKIQGCWTLLGFFGGSYAYWGVVAFGFRNFSDQKFEKLGGKLMTGVMAFLFYVLLLFLIFILPYSWDVLFPS